VTNWAITVTKFNLFLDLSIAPPYTFHPSVELTALPQILSWIKGRESKMRRAKRRRGEESKGMKKVGGKRRGEISISFTSLKPKCQACPLQWLHVITPTT